MQLGTGTTHFSFIAPYVDLDYIGFTSYSSLPPDSQEGDPVCAVFQRFFDLLHSCKSCPDKKLLSCPWTIDCVFCSILPLLLWDLHILDPCKDICPILTIAPPPNSKGTTKKRKSKINDETRNGTAAQFTFIFSSCVATYWVAVSTCNQV